MSVIGRLLSHAANPGIVRDIGSVGAAASSGSHVGITRVLIAGAIAAAAVAAGILSGCSSTGSDQARAGVAQLPYPRTG